MNPPKGLYLIFAICCALGLFSTKLHGQCTPLSDSLELVKLYDATNGDNWTNKTNWKVVGKPISTWYGISVDANGCVTCIDLDGRLGCRGIILSSDIGNNGNNLVGVLPITLQNLQNLTGLYLSFNKLSGTIPNFDLPNLQHLHLMENPLSGNIPNFNLPNLQTLFLVNNQLNGSIPNFSMPNLQNLSIGGTQLSGTIPNFNMQNLQNLFISGSLLSGTIPNFNMPNLQGLSITGSMLSGTIPNFNMPNMQNLFISGSLLSGTIPNFNMPNLQRLNIFDTQISGTIPNFNMPKLQSLSITGSMLSGTIPNFNMPNLERLDIIGTKIDSCPMFTNLISLKKDTVTGQRGLRSNGNNLTFDDILPNIGLATTATYIYSPQNSIYKDTTIALTTGSSYNIDLRIDYGITTNVYKWKKNGVDYRTVIGSPRLPLSNIALSDAGKYTCTVTNPSVSGLTLTSRDITVTVFSSCRVQDSLALMDLYKATNGANWTNKWDTTKPIDTWYGVSLNAQGCLTCIDLDGNNDCNSSNVRLGNNLVGILPNMEMNNLEGLFLSDNKIRNIPNFIMPNLKNLTLYNNQLKDSIPSSLGNLSNLVELDMANNQLNSVIPSSLGSLSNIILLDLGGNQLKDTIPSSLGNLSNLVIFNLGNNQLTGKIPISFQNLMRLGNFWFDSNKIDSCPNLSLLPIVGSGMERNKLTFDDILPNISRNQFSYAPQDSIYKDTTITIQLAETLTIDLNIDGAITNNNYKWFKNGIFLKDTNRNKLILRGVKPTDAGIYTCEVTNPNVPALTLNTRNITIDIVTTCRSLDSLALVDLYTTTDGANWTVKWDLSSPIDTWFGITLTAQECVERIFLPNNGLKGTIPNLDLPNLVQLTLSRNQLAGNIPNFNMPKLVGLALSGNQLEGNIPDFYLPELQTLSLFSNKLDGNIPNFNLPKLQGLLLNDNQLTGSIPNFNLPKLLYLRLQANKLSGTIPNFNLLPKLEELALSNNELSGTIPNFNLPVLKGLHLNDNKLTGCFPNSLKVHCALGFNTTIGQNGYNFTNNPALPWSGDFTRFCNNSNQIGAPCNDGNAATQKDIITASCACAGRICTSIDAIDDKVIIKDAETAVEFTTTTNDRFDAGAQLSVKVLKKPLNGTLDSLNTGKFRYTIIPTLRGSVQKITYLLCDTACLNLCDSADVRIEVEGLALAIKTSKGITPYNQDGKNDALEFEEIEDRTRYPNSELIVYNRWNSIVYRAQPYQNDWGGINLQGLPLPTGTYYYILHLNKATNETLTGDVVIIK